MKKAVKITVISVIVFLVVSLSVSLIVSLRRKNTLDEVPKVFITDETSYGDYSFEIVRKSDSFYYPTLSGYVVVKNKPTKITVVCNNSEKGVEMQSVKYKNGFWIITFNEEILYGYLKQGDYNAVINVYSDIENTSVNSNAVLVADEDYFCFSGVSGNFFDGGKAEYIYAMDKESNWIGPF